MIPHNKPTISNLEEEEACRVLRSGWLAQGPEVELLENEFCEYHGLNEGHAVAVSSGTAGLYLALWALNAAEQKIALPVYSCSALRNAVNLIGAHEHLTDCSPTSPNIDIEQILPTKATIAIVAHIFGIPSKIPSNQPYKIIEDCAQSIGASTNNVPVGIQGDIGVFSFYATKPITAGGQGGMIISKDRSLIERIKDYRNFDCRNDQRARFNFQMTDVQAAIARVQLKKLPQFLKIRSEIYQRYLESGLTFWNELFCNSTLHPKISQNYFRCVLKSKDPKKTIDILAKQNIRTIIPIEDWELLGRGCHFPNAENLTRTTVSLPIYPSLKGAEVDLVFKALQRLEAD